jgi:phosphoribosylformylglycinamidine synthase subunit PurS
MKFLAEIDIMPLDDLLDPQGKVIGSNLPRLGITGVDNVRVGKHITLEIDAATEAVAKETVSIMCKKLLANQVIEKFSFDLKQI